MQIEARLVQAQPLTAEAFAPFGDVIDVPSEAGRKYYEDALGNLRAGAWPSLSISQREPVTERPVRAELLERHEFSSQTFMPIESGRWLVIVAPHAAAGGPDLSGVRAFIATGKQGVTYRPNTWHHGHTVLERTSRFAVFMFRDGGTGDEEFVPVPPFTIRVD